MKKIILLFFIFSVINLFSNENHYIPNFSLFSNDNKQTIENPFRNIDNDWFKEDLRREKIVIAVGVICIAAGLPLLLSGILNLTAPSVDTPDISLNTYYVFTGVGAGLLAVGTGITIGGGIAFAVGRKKLEVELLGFKLK